MNRRALVLAFVAIALCFAPRVHRDSATAPVPGSTTRAPAASARLAPATPPSPAEADVAPQPADDPKPSSAPRPSMFFGETGPVALAEIPAGPFRDSLEALPPAARQAALARFSRARVPLSQIGTLRAAASGGLIHICPEALPSALPEDTEEPVAAASTGGASVPVSSPPALNSKPGASRVLYLDFNGHVVTGTAWNQGPGASPRYDALPYDIDGNYATFSDQEQAIIREVWARVAEDYAPFDINVTTVDPVNFSPYVGRALITQAVDANSLYVPGGQNYGGIAYVDVYSYSEYEFFSPAWVIADNVGTDNAANIAEAVSHEFGHNLGLSHDGTSSLAYYRGHGSGATSWGPIMGASYGRNVTTFSRGDYYDANNPQDDLAIITARVPYRNDAVGDTIANANTTDLGAQGAVATGLIERSTDADVFRLSTSSGVISVEIAAFAAASNTRGNNLDLAVDLLASDGSRVSRHESPYSPDITINTQLSPGTYYLRLFSVGAGNPASSSPTGYTGYGSLGAYTITNNTNPTPPPSILQQPADAVRPVASSHTFTVVADATATSYQWRFNGTPIGGAVSPSLSLNSITFSRAGAYTCLVSNGAAVISTQPAQLAVYRNNARVLTVNPGFNLTFPSLVAGAFDDLSWSHDGQTIVPTPRVFPSGSAFRIYGVEPSDAGVYTLAASFAGQAVAIGPVTLAVRPPVVLSAPESVTVDRGKVPVLPLVSSHDNLTYSYSGLPAGIGFDPATGLLGAVGAAPGDYSLKLTGIDPYGNAGSTTFQLVVQARTLPFTVPELLRAYPTTAPALDAQNDSPLASYTYTGLPPGALYERSTGRISFSQTVRAGAYPVTVFVTDIYGNTASASFTLEVSALPAARALPYVGVIDRHPTLNLSLGGKVTLTPVFSRGAPTGGYSGSLSLGTVNYALSGRIVAGGPDSDLSLNLTGKARGRPNLSLTITLPLDLSAPASGTISATNTTSVAFSAWPAPYGKTKPATGYVGNHVFALLPPDEASATEPAGVGFGNLSVSSAGKASWSATLADGTRASGSTALGLGGQVPVFALLRTPGGSLHGSVALSAPGRAIDGELSWLRARATTKAYPTAVLYRDGFGPVSLTALGGPLVIPPAGTRVLGLSAASPGVKLVFSGGGLSETQLAQLALPSLVVTTKNTVQRPTTAAANPAALVLSLKAAKSTFGGSFVFKEPNPLKPGALVARKAVFAGVLLGDQGVGYFLFPGIKTSLATPASTLSGPVTLEPLSGTE